MLAAALFAVACGSDDEPLEAPTATPVSAPLPYSWEESSLRITVVEVVPATSDHGISILDGYRQYTVNFRYENLLHEDWEPPRECPGCSTEGAGIDSLKLLTDQSNAYEPRFVGGTPLYHTLKPQQVLDQTELYIFEIKAEEVPVELEGFEKGRLAYVFALR